MSWGVIKGFGQRDSPYGTNLGNRIDTVRAHNGNRVVTLADPSRIVILAEGELTV